MVVLQELHSNTIDPRGNRLFFMMNENTNVRTGCDQTSTRRLGTSLVRVVEKQEKSMPEPVKHAGQAVCKTYIMLWVILDTQFACNMFLFPTNINLNIDKFLAPRYWLYCFC